MTKRQKNALLDDGVCDVVDHLQRLSGATFPRIVTAALLKYAFGGLQPPDPPDGTNPESIWMQIAVDIERGDFTVDEIPHRLLERGMEISQEYIQFYDQDDITDQDEQKLKRWHAEHHRRHSNFRRWNDLIASTGGERAALKLIIQARGIWPNPE